MTRSHNLDPEPRFTSRALRNPSDHAITNGTERIHDAQTQKPWQKHKYPVPPPTFSSSSSPFTNTELLNRCYTNIPTYITLTSSHSQAHSLSLTLSVSQYSQTLRNSTCLPSPFPSLLASPLLPAVAGAVRPHQFQLQPPPLQQSASKRGESALWPSSTCPS